MSNPTHSHTSRYCTVWNVQVAQPQGPWNCRGSCCHRADWGSPGYI